MKCRCFYPIFILVLFLLTSCGNTKDFAYFQDAYPGVLNPSVEHPINTIKPGDLISILVSSSKPELAVPYNLFSVRSQMSTSQSLLGVAPASNSSLEGYTVHGDGTINFPVLGSMHVAGLNREELSERLRNQLIDVMPDPVVTVSFLNFNVVVLGEVARPGTLTLQGDRVTLLEAIGMAGDLTVYGKRAKVYVFREINGQRQMDILDMRSRNLFDSPYFYLQQNDVVYVEPLGVRARTTSAFANALPILTSIASLMTSIALCVFYLGRIE